jgi:hypothetical protein
MQQTDTANPSAAAPQDKRLKTTDVTLRADEQALAKANEAIAIRPKRGKLTLLSRRIYNVFLYHAQQQGVDSPSYTILLSELIDDARFASNNTELLKSHIRDMQATTIEWHTSSGTARQWISTQLLGAVTIDEPGRGRPCTVTWSYPEPIRERIVKPSHYTRILLEMGAQLRSYAASVLYELGARYLTSPGRLTMREDLVWWASVLTGRSDITTVDYRFLHRDTIKKALAELDALCDDFKLEVVEHRRGRKVEEIQFRVHPKVQPKLAGLAEGGKNVFDLQLVERALALGFKRTDVEEIYAKTDEGLLRAAIEHVEQRMKNATLPPLTSPAAYLRDALKKQYAGRGEGGLKVKPADEEGRGSTDKVELPTPTLALSERMLLLRNDWKHEQAQRARAHLESLPPDQRDAVVARFVAEQLPLLTAPVAKAWRSAGTTNPVANAAFYSWLASELWSAEVTDRELLEFAVTRTP